MVKLKVIFSIDPTGFEKDIEELILIKNETCLYCLHDKENRLINEIKTKLTNKGYDLNYYFQIMKIYTR